MSYRDIIIATYFHSEGDIFSYSFSRKELKILEYHTDTSSVGEQIMRAHFVDIMLTLIIYISRFWYERTDQAFYKTCLSASRSSYEKEEFSFFYIYI